MSACEDDHFFSRDQGKLRKKSVHGSRTSPRTDRDTLKLKDLAVRPEGLEGRTAILHSFGKDKEDKYKSSSFLFTTPWSFAASTSGQVHQCLQINELNPFAFGKGVRVRRKRTGRDDVTGLCAGAHKRAVEIPDHRFPHRNTPTLALNGDQLIALTE